MSGKASAIIADLFRAADGVFAVDADRRITFWNQASERFLGISARHALGRRCYEFVHGRDSKGRPVCGAGCRIARLTNGGIAPETFALSLHGGCEPRRLYVNIVLVPSPTKGLWTAFHVLHQEKTPGHAASEPSLPQPIAAERSARDTRTGAAAACALTTREQQVLQLLAEALPATAISRRLHISRTTVRNHIQHILAKLELHSKVEAVAYAYRHRLISGP